MKSLDLLNNHIKEWLLKLDVMLISKVSIAIVYILFGGIKVIGLSPAFELVNKLAEITIPFIPVNLFIIFLGLVEIIIGLLLLLPKLYTYTVAIFLLHMISTLLPLLVLPDIAWGGLLIPTIEGQYILKNLVLISLVLMIFKQQNENSKF